MNVCFQAKELNLKCICKSLYPNFLQHVRTGGGGGEWSTPFGLDLFSDNVFNVGEHCHASI